MLLITGGFDTTTALTAHSLEYLGQHPAERSRLSASRDTLLDSATEEFLRFFTPAPGDGRTFSADCAIAGTEFREGERIWLSWAMANRDPSVFPDPDTIDLARTGNRHTSFGLGIHRCIGSHLARVMFEVIVRAVLERMPDYAVDLGSIEEYAGNPTMTGIVKMPATFTPGRPLGTARPY